MDLVVAWCLVGQIYAIFKSGSPLHNSSSEKFSITFDSEQRRQPVQLPISRSCRSADQRTITVKITANLIQQFCEAHAIIAKLAYGRLRLSDKKEIYIKKTVSYHTGEASRAFSPRLLHPDYMHSMGETYLIHDMSKPR